MLESPFKIYGYRPNMIEDFPLEYEQRSGAEYGSIEGGVHYENLGLLSGPILESLAPTSGRIRLADFGAGSGIVGLHVRDVLEGQGSEPDLYAIDKNPEQLEGVDFESSRYSHNSAIAVLADLLDLGIENEFDCGTMRMVLNYMTKDQIPVALRNVAKSLNPGAVFVNCAMVAFTPEQAVFYNDFRYPSSDRILFGGDYARRYIPELEELIAMQRTVFGNCLVTGSVKLDQTSRNVQHRFSFTDRQTDGMIGEWFSAPERARRELNLRVDQDGIAHYDWWNVALTSIKT
jgi:hypothetical protein